MQNFMVDAQPEVPNCDARKKYEGDADGNPEQFNFSEDNACGYYQSKQQDGMSNAIARKEFCYPVHICFME
jgi:hypothetical protein